VNVAASRQDLRRAQKIPAGNRTNEPTVECAQQGRNFVIFRQQTVRFLELSECIAICLVRRDSGDRDRLIRRCAIHDGFESGTNISQAVSCLCDRLKRVDPLFR